MCFHLAILHWQPNHHHFTLFLFWFETLCSESVFWKNPWCRIWPLQLCGTNGPYGHIYVYFTYAPLLRCWLQVCRLNQSCNVVDGFLTWLKLVVSYHNGTNTGSASKSMCKCSQNKLLTKAHPVCFRSPCNVQAASKTSHSNHWAYPDLR